MHALKRWGAVNITKPTAAVGEVASLHIGLQGQDFSLIAQKFRAIGCNFFGHGVEVLDVSRTDVANDLS